MSVTIPHNKIGDLEVSKLALGTWQFGDTFFYKKNTPEVEAQIVKTAFDCGINFFDTAEGYGNGVSEKALGAALSKSGRTREEYVLASKAVGDCLEPTKLRQTVQNTLDNLQTSYLDLMQIHWYNPSIKPSIYIPVLQELVDEGKIRAIGISNFGVQQMTETLDLGIPIVSNQLPYSLLNRCIEDDIVPFCHSHSMNVLAYSPLSQGLLTGKYTTTEQCPDGLSRSRYFNCKSSSMSRHGSEGNEPLLWDTLSKLKTMSQQLNITLPQLSLSYVLSQGYVDNMIFGVSRPEQIISNIEAVNIKLSPESISQANSISEPMKVFLNGNPDLWNDKNRCL
ncbi:hypothetical protein WA158_005056 [Blastocystis sp. Blastoise]